MLESYRLARRQLSRKLQRGWNGLGVRARIGLRLIHRAKHRSGPEDDNANEQQARSETAHPTLFLGAIE
jgi:hypothetical protein